MYYILWHKNPDTDAIASAVVYAHYLRDQWYDAQSIMLGHPNRETLFVLEQAWVDHPELVTNLEPWSSLVLVDHNECGQSIEDRHQYDIVAIIDHHKIADIQTSWPLMMRVEPVWCTCTVLYEMFVADGYKPSSELALLMVSAILSDTLHFRSPTTTQRDRDAVESLAGRADIDDVASYAMQMFDAKSDLSGIDPIDIVNMDYKIFEMGNQRVGIGVMETTNPSFAREREDELRHAMQQTKDNDEIDYMVFCVVDILHEENTAIILSADEENLMQRAFGVAAEEEKVSLGNRVSRKKQIVPAIHDVLAA